MYESWIRERFLQLHTWQTRNSFKPRTAYKSRSIFSDSVTSIYSLCVWIQFRIPVLVLLETALAVYCFVYETRNEFWASLFYYKWLNWCITFWIKCLKVWNIQGQTDTGKNWLMTGRRKKELLEISQIFLKIAKLSNIKQKNLPWVSKISLARILKTSIKV